MKREVDSSGNCNKCGGVHYGSYKCPYTDAQVEAMCSSDLSAGSAEPSSTSTITKQLGEATESQLTSISTTAGTATSDSRSSAPSPEELAREIVAECNADLGMGVSEADDPLIARVTALLRSRMAERAFWVIERFENGKSAGYWIR